MPYPGLLYPEPLPLWQATADPYHCRRHSSTVLAQSLWGPWVLVSTSFVWALWVSLAGKGFESKLYFTPLPSCWGFCFALGRGVSFFGGIQLSPVNSYSAASCSFGVFKEDEHMSFCSAILRLLYWLCQSLWLCGSQQTGKFLKRWEYQATWPASWGICMQVKKQQLELDMEQQTGYKSGQEYVKAVHCHPVYITYMQSTS